MDFGNVSRHKAYVEPQDYPLNAAAFAYTKARENLGLRDVDFKEATARVG
ncbi:hypothetical protein Pmar_PMAR011537 [Perkinsus marinus ATCC 50983]|uniref:Uncharacterized protein n=1 Tax=Perkinsus marinus (strain ATCC 50983 / TXsc) TaxID=423536 RepID=C5LC30_PERM5|nr:hypothetical protein Pmar_PMAR011537 [Perkinsus marinus ATCC 50983]EER05513.1 hypothetical protein Pmar_PMAR011537 [Perkinsus marinus ATCC 50983]|eukprot:XP_002773697.1 hypothetical protein Pmar_PMAR011537 [Perkinsus marinus ATCC 50983]